MALLIFHYTLAILLVAIIASATCLSAYLVSHKRLFLFAFAAFLFYFCDTVLVFQDEFIAHVTGADLSPSYMAVRSLVSIASGGGFLAAFWLLICDYLGEARRALLATPPAVFVVASVVMLFALPEGDVQRFWFWTMRQLFIYWILLYVGVRAARTRDAVERERMHRHRGIYVLAWVFSLAILAEDIVCFLVLDSSTVSIGALSFTTERNYAENALLVCCAVAAFRAAWRVLSLRFERPPSRGSKQQEQQITENLNVYAKRHGLSAREREVLYLVLLGKDNQNIASDMQLALSTVKVHVHNILQKTKLANRQALIQDFWKTS